MSKETPKQRLRRILDRLKPGDDVRREADKLIEEMPDEDAEGFVAWLDDLEKEAPGLVDEAIKELAKQGYGPDG